MAISWNSIAGKRRTKLGRRQERLNHLLRGELALILQRQVRDPRLSGLISITQVKISPDLKYAQIFISILGTKEEKEGTMNALSAASGFFRHELSLKLHWRRMPLLHFLRDDSLEEGAHVLELMRQALPTQD